MVSSRAVQLEWAQPEAARERVNSRPTANSIQTRPLAMSLILPTLLVTAAQYVAFASPTPTTNVTFTNIHVDAFSSHPSLCNELYHCRSLTSIVWSCLTTIFLCTWVAMHPDVPDKSETSWRDRFISHIFNMAVMIMAPEYFVVQAFDQWIKACDWIKTISGNGCFLSSIFDCLRSDIPEQYPNVRWTETHGMMAYMKGFELLKDDDPKKTRLHYENIKRDFQGYEVDFSTITEDIIMDRSKGDAVAKALVILQTSWFAVQCAARVGQGLLVTKLEVTTLGHTALICFIYILWWNKPLHVVYPLTLHAKRLESRAAWAGLEADGGDASSLELSHTTSLMTISTPPPKPSLKVCPLSWRIQFGSYICSIYQAQSFDMRKRRMIMNLLGYIFGLLAMGIFGAIHCLAWNLHFPSYVEHPLARIRPHCHSMSYCSGIWPWRRRTATPKTSP
jgi:hypothetical protein